MTKAKRGQHKADKSSGRNFWSACFLIIGSVVLFTVALSMIKINLASHQSSRRYYLSSLSEFNFSLPVKQPETLLEKTVEPVVVVQPTEENTPAPSIQTPSTAVQELPMQPSDATEPAIQPTPLMPTDAVIASEPAQPLETTQEPAPIPSGTVVPEVFAAPLNQTSRDPDGPTVVYLPVINSDTQPPSDTPSSPPSTDEDPMAGPPPGAVPGPSAGAVVRLLIPSLRIDRAVVVVGLKTGQNKQVTWNTDALFSNANRSDLVGQTITSANPGEGGNIILIGHNYNNGWSANGAVFVNLLSLKPGSDITVFTESGKEFHYTVNLVKKVPWKEQSDIELQKHHKYMWPTDHEQLTLVTCGGINLGVWSARIYAIALPADTQNQP